MTLKDLILADYLRQEERRQRGQLDTVQKLGETIIMLACQQCLKKFHFDPVPAPASQVGGFGFSSSSVVHNLLPSKKVLKISLLNLPVLVLFTEKYECFALLFQYFIERDRLIYFTLLFKIWFIS